MSATRPVVTIATGPRTASRHERSGLRSRLAAGVFEDRVPLDEIMKATCGCRRFDRLGVDHLEVLSIGDDARGNEAVDALHGSDLGFPSATQASISPASGIASDAGLLLRPVRDRRILVAGRNRAAARVHPTRDDGAAVRWPDGSPVPRQAEEVRCHSTEA